jgi:hypothetical protein
MNAERLHAIANVVVEDEAQRNILAIFAELVTNLRHQVNEPANPNYPQQVASARQSLQAALKDSRTNQFSPAWVQTLEELEGADLVGEKLLDQIEEVFTRHGITVTLAAEELEPLLLRAQEFYGALIKVLAGLDSIHVGREELAPEEFEIGFLIPRDQVGNELEGLGKEFVEINRKILDPLFELVTGNRPDIRVRSISSSSFQVFLDSPPAVAALLAGVVHKIVQAYDKVLDIRLKHKDLKDREAPEKLLDELQAWAEEIMEAAIEKEVKVLLDEYMTEAQGREHELRNDLTRAFKEIADRIDRGYNIDVRAPELPEETVAEEGEEATEPDETTRAAQAIASVRESLTFMHIEGEPILHLSKTTDDVEPDDSEDDQSSDPDRSQKDEIPDARRSPRVRRRRDDGPRSSSPEPTEASGPEAADPEAAGPEAAGPEPAG